MQALIIIKTVSDSLHTKRELFSRKGIPLHMIWKYMLPFRHFLINKKDKNMIKKMLVIRDCVESQNIKGGAWFLFTLTGWFWGDPHITTLDGKRYTFNGLGEYTLVTTRNFTLQGRTGRARDSNDQPTNATVFTAFAAADINSDVLQVNLNPDRAGEVSVFLLSVSVLFFVSFVCLFVQLNFSLCYLGKWFHSFIHSFVRSFLCSFFRLFVRSFIQWVNQSVSRFTFALRMCICK